MDESRWVEGRLRRALGKCGTEFIKAGVVKQVHIEIAVVDRFHNL